MPTYLEVGPGGKSVAEPAALVTACLESGHGSALIHGSALPPEFFDLRSGLAGELLHRASVYHVRLAFVDPDPDTRPARFREMAAEANGGRAFRFFASREEAGLWLEEES